MLKENDICMYLSAFDGLHDDGLLPWRPSLMGNASNGALRGRRRWERSRALGSGTRQGRTLAVGQSTGIGRRRSHQFGRRSRRVGRRRGGGGRRKGTARLRVEIERLHLLRQLCLRLRSVLHDQRLRPSGRKRRSGAGAARSRNGRGVGHGRHALQHLLHITRVLLIGRFGGGRRWRRQRRRWRSGASGGRRRRRLGIGGVGTAWRIRRHFGRHVTADEAQSVEVGGAVRTRGGRPRVPERRTAPLLHIAFEARLPVHLARHRRKTLKCPYNTSQFQFHSISFQSNYNFKLALQHHLR